MDYDDDGYEGRTEPHCTRCDDHGQLRVLDETTWTWRDVGNCPECNPSEAQQAERDAEYALAVASGDIDPDADPWF